MENIGKILSDDAIPAWLKTIIVIVIISAAIAGIIVPFLTAYTNSRKKTAGSEASRSDSLKPDSSSEISLEAKLEQHYTSLFAEDGKLKSEQITITKQRHQDIEGIVTLVETDLSGNRRTTFTYEMKGKFSNHILTAEYFSKSDLADERGAINLKLIGQHILSGFCSFSKVSSSADDEIRVSPYVWVAGEEKDLLNGTFDFCTVCHEEHRVCCCASDKVDMPVFLNNELALIRSKLATKEKNIFSKPLPAPFNKSSVRQMKREEDKDLASGSTATRCHFYDSTKQQCNIYEGRPIDCRLFPYDIKLSEDTKDYKIGYYSTLCSRTLPELSVMKQKAHILRPYFFLLYPYLHIITSDSVCQKLNQAEFQEIADFKDFVF